MAAWRQGDHDAQERKVALRRLDWCLTQLEDANVRGDVRVGHELVRGLRDAHLHITAGMSIRAAMAVVLRAQERFLQPEALPIPHETGSQALDATAARRLTERIRTAVGEVCLLLLEAHQRRAWIALGYSSWHEYVRAEFRLSRSRSYELLDHARVIQAIEQASGLSAVADISTLTARQLRNRLPAVTARIRARIGDDAAADRRAVVLEVIREEKHRSVRGDVPVRTMASWDGAGVDPDRLRESITYLARLHDARRVADQLPHGLRAELEQVQAALRWLGEFRDACIAGDGMTRASAFT